MIASDEMTRIGVQNNERPLGAGVSSLDFHKGEAFLRIASDYPTLVDVILEQIQNAIDEDAGSISVMLNRKTRNISIRDDGNGVGVASFEEALDAVCKSRKEIGKLGRFGIGLISPLGKCEFSTFVSCPKGQRSGYVEWTFITDNIREQDRLVTIPRKPRPDLIFRNRGERPPHGKTGVGWQTEVSIYRYSSDKFISRITSIDSLTDTILERFGPVMRKKDVVLNLKFTNEDGKDEIREGVRAKQFTGLSLGLVEMQEKDAGRVSFELYLAPRTTKGLNGKVIVGEKDNDYRFSFRHLARSSEGILPDDIASALCSGIFEGEILADNVTLHVSRKAFEKNDAFIGMCSAIETWYKEHGLQHLEEVKEARRDQRYQELGLESLKEIESLLQDPAAADLRKVLEGFTVGSVGEHHARRPQKKILGESDQTSLSTHGTEPKDRDGSCEGEGYDKPDGDKQNHHPFTVEGPRGRVRTLVKRDSVGLQFSYIAMDGSDRLWELDTKRGILHFNVNHPTWVACDVSDRKVRQLQETVAIQALMVEAMPTELADSIRYAFDETLKPLTRLFHASPAFNLRKRIASKD